MLAVVGGLLAGNSLRSQYENGFLESATGEFYAESKPISENDSGEFIGLSPAAYFDSIRRLLLKEYVEPITDETKLARGSVRSMLQELGDVSTRFYEPDEWMAYTDVFDGTYHGIGADLAVREEMSDGIVQFPIRVVSVAEGGYADTAGLKQGDWIEEINGKWIASRSLWNDLQIANEKFARKEITSDQYDKVFEQLKTLSERSTPVILALKDLQAVDEGTVELQVRRGNTELKISVPRGKYHFEPIEERDGIIKIRSFPKNAAQKLSRFIGTRDRVILDLRGNPGGYFDAVENSLSLLLPAGEYAKMKADIDVPLAPLKLEKGSETKRSITVYADKGTAREAELFVSALKEQGANVIGGPTYGLGERIERYRLSDGSGYTISAARFYSLDGKPLYIEANTRSKPVPLPKSIESGARQSK